MYDARLGRWLSIDPLAKKYPDLSPYNFVANNPILLVDKDGREIIINGSADFQKQTLSAIQKLTSVQLALDADNRVVAVSDPKNPSSNTKVFGTSLVNQLLYTNNKVQIGQVFGDPKTTTAGANSTTPQGLNSKINLNLAELKLKDVNGEQTVTPLEIVVGHELLHASDIDVGRKQTESSDKYDPEVGTLSPLSNAEVETRFRENILRKEQEIVGRAKPTDVPQANNLEQIEISPPKNDKDEKK